MKNRFLSILALIALTFTAAADQVGPYLWTYSGTPVSAPVTAINPPPGAQVIDIVTGTRYRKISAIGSNASYAIDPIETVTANSPLTGATITANALKSDAIEYLTPAGTIAALTYTFPSNTNSRIGQRLTLLSTQIVTALTISASGQTVTSTTALAANTPATFIKVAASTWIRISNTPTTVGIAITSPVITTGLTASGSTANDFSASTGTFLTSTGANTLGGAVSIADATTPSLTLATGKTNTGFISILGKTSGGLKLTVADASAFLVTATLSAQTTATAALTIPDFGGVADEFTFKTKSQTMANKTLTSPVIATGLTASGSASNDFSSSTGTMKTSSGLFTVSGPAAVSTGTLSGPGAISVVKGTTKVTTTGVADALTLADGTDGQIITIIHDVDGGSAVLTPTTKTGYTTITFTAVGESCMLQFVTTRGWMIISLRGAVAA